MKKKNNEEKLKNEIISQIITIWSVYQPIEQ